MAVIRKEDDYGINPDDAKNWPRIKFWTQNSSVLKAALEADDFFSKVVEYGLQDSFVIPVVDALLDPIREEPDDFHAGSFDYGTTLGYRLRIKREFAQQLKMAANNVAHPVGTSMRILIDRGMTEGIMQDAHVARYFADITNIVFSIACQDRKIQYAGCSKVSLFDDAESPYWGMIEIGFKKPQG